MKKFKRNICTTIILIILLITMCIPSYASNLEVNKEKLKNAFETIFTENTEDGLKIEEGAAFKQITDSTIEFELDGKTAIINYEMVDNKAIFRNTVNITEGMSYDKYEEETANLSMPLMGYVAVANIAGVELEDSLTYMLLSMLESAFGSLVSGEITEETGYMIIEDGVTVESSDNLKVIKKSEFGKYAVEYAEAFYKDSVSYDDSKGLNTYGIKYRTNKTEKNYEIEFITTVNLEGDFAKITEQANKGEIEQIKQNVLKSVKLSCEKLKNTISEEIKKDENYSIDANMSKIQETLVASLKSEQTGLDAEGWKVGELLTDGTFTIIYEGEDYKNVSNDENAKIAYRVVIGKNTIELITGKIDDGEKHIYEAKTTIEPTCTRLGAKLYKCTDCDASYTDAVLALGHDYGSKVTTEPTCIEQGIRTYICKRCNNSYGEHISTTKHNYVERIRTEKDCEKDATINYICTYCGELYTKVTAKATGHNYKVTTKAATCTTAGSRIYTCSNCQDSYTEVTSKAIGHNYVEEKTAEGVEKYTCSNCNASYTNEAPNADLDNKIPQTPDNESLDNTAYIIIGAVAGVVILIIAIIVVSVRKREI